MSGKLVISLDFEGMWGSIGSKHLGEFNKRTEDIDLYISRLVGIFDQYEIHATWGIVGAMLCESKEEALSFIPTDIYYDNFGISIRDYISNISNDKSYKYFAKRLVSTIRSIPNQEIASHTFSHFYTLEEGANSTLMRQELEAIDIIMKQNGIKVESIILPRNMVNLEFIPILAEYGYKAYRGRQNIVINNGKGERNRLIDFVDSYFPIRNDLCYKTNEIQNIDGLFNLKASMFFRTFDKRFGKLENLKISRIKKEMLKSAKYNKVFHIWWHPHNMASDLDWNCRALKELFEYYTKLHDKYGYESANMSEIVKLIK